MNLADIKDQIRIQSQNALEKIQASEAYIQVKDRFDSLQPMAQRGVIFGGGALIALFLISFPIGYLSSSDELMASFNSKRELIRSMFKVVADEQSIPSLPSPPDALALKSMIENQLQSKQLAKEQVVSVQAADSSEVSISNTLIDGSVIVSLSKLNVAQIIELGTSLESLSKAVSLWDMNIKANSADPRYFDVIYKLAIFRIIKNEDPPSSSLPKRGRRNRG